MAISKETIKISIIVPCYNQAEFLDECLTSVFNQIYTDWECIIVNDGSPDNTEELALKWVKKDPRFIYKYKENGGLSSARNLGLKVAKNEWIQFLDCDDYLDKNKLEKSVTKIIKDKNLNLIITNFNCYDQNTKALLPPYCNINITLDLETIIKGWDTTFSIPIHCSLIKRNLLKNGFNEDLKAKEDWLMWIEVFSNKIKYSIINEYLAFYRLHMNSMTKDLSFMQDNTLNVYLFIFNQIDIKYKDLFFKRVISDVRNNYLLKDDKIHFLINSATYKIGNLILKPIKLLRNLIRYIHH